MKLFVTIFFVTIFSKTTIMPRGTILPPVSYISNKKIN
jgi:hypothetical protein